MLLLGPLCMTLKYIYMEKMSLFCSSSTSVSIKLSLYYIFILPPETAFLCRYYEQGFLEKLERGLDIIFKQSVSCLRVVYHYLCFLYREAFHSLYIHFKGLRTISWN